MPESTDHPHLTDDEKHLASLGYKQELERSWAGFINFAISFSIISILAGRRSAAASGWRSSARATAGPQPQRGCATVTGASTWPAHVCRSG